MAVSTLIKTHFHVFPIPTHLELFQRPPQIELPRFTWNIHPKLTLLLCKTFVVYNQLSSIKFDQTYQLNAENCNQNYFFHPRLAVLWNIFHFSTLCLTSSLCGVSIIKTHFHVFPPTPTWNLYLHTWNFFNTHPNSNTHFSLGTSIQTAVVGWNLLGEFKFFHPKTPVCRS